MATRRTFLKSLSATLAGSLLLPAESIAFPARKDIGIQLYTIRELLKNDFTGTLEVLAKIGFTSIEAAGYGNRAFYGYKPPEYRKLCFDLGLDPLSSHSSVTKENADIVIEDTLNAGMRYLVVPSPGNEPVNSIDDFKKFADNLNHIGEKCRIAGLKFGYHNHDFEFETKEEMVPYDILLDRTDPKFCFMQIDLYWMKYAGFDPVIYFSNYPGRFELWHVKDMDAGITKECTEIGKGILNYAQIFSQKHKAGMKHFFVEQESFRIDPIESISQSLNYIKSVL